MKFTRKATAIAIYYVCWPLDYHAPAEGALSDDARLTSVAYIGPKSRTERLRKTKIGAVVAHVTRDSDTTFKVKRSKVKVTCEAWVYCGGLPHSLLSCTISIEHIQKLSLSDIYFS